nr:retrovirus-related Pol polyprotein from transposon TNT 1-94 [Tanacetum cinerariifolium]
MDLCSPMRVESINGIEHQTSVARTPKQNGVVERRNRTLVEATRTMLSAAKVPLFSWAEAIAITCFTQNRSLLIPRHEKTPYHIINCIKPSVKFFHILALYAISSEMITSDHVSSDPASQCLTKALEYGSLSPASQSKANVTLADDTVTTSINELDMLFSLMFDRYFNGASLVMSKSSAVSTANAPDERQKQNTTPSTSATVDVDMSPLIILTPTEPTIQAPTQEPTVTTSENINQADIQSETQEENVMADEEKFINIFSTHVHEIGESSTQHVDLSNTHTYY